MKIFDMHVHVFPDAVAHKAVDNLADYYHVKMASGGTLADFEQSVRETPDIKKCLIHSTATTAHQVESVNNFVASLINDDILGFGSMHPDYGDIAGEMDRMISLGLRGIKLHTDFQRFNADSDEACKIYECAEGKLPILFHAGDKNTDFSSPRRIRHVHDMFPNLTIIAAHLGGYSEWDESEKYLVGTDVYFDTSSVLQSISKEQAVRIIRNHGADKCFFGTDYPMHNRALVEKQFLELGLTEEENRKILWDNAIKFFDL